MQAHEPICLVDGHHGVYVPQVFAELYRAGDITVIGVDADDIDCLLAGPDHPDYWEAWQAVEQFAIVDIDNRPGYLLQGECGDLFAHHIFKNS